MDGKRVAASPSFEASIQLAHHCNIISQHNGVRIMLPIKEESTTTTSGNDLSATMKFWY
jgi:hypothetical protein